MLGITLLAGIALLAIFFGPRLIGDQQEQGGIAAFYDASEVQVEGAPGSVARIEPLVGHPFDAKAWRVMYRTVDVHGTPQLATGVIVTPLGSAPDTGRTVLAWGHPTTGAAAECAPSRGFDPFIGIEGLRFLLDRGYTVVATDYVGMGVAGPDSYLIGDTAGNSMLDAVRAAQSVEEADASGRVILWGHSQGGQAALFAAERAPDYAPELHIEAVAVAAPAADLSALISDHVDDVSGATIGSYAFQAYAEVYADRGARLDTVLTPAAQQILPEMNQLCLLTHLTELHDIAEPVVGNFFAADPTQVEPWATLLKENSAGSHAFDAPLFVAQGAKDQLVLPTATEQFVEHEKSLGMPVSSHVIREADHGSIAYLSLPALMSWLDELSL